MRGYNPHNKSILKEALKGKGACTLIKAGARLQYNWKETDVEGSDPLTNIIGLMEWSENEIILDYICETQGGVFVKYEDAGESTGNLHQDASAMLSELTDVYTVMSESMKDGKIDMQEAEAIRKEAKEAMRQIEVMLDNVQRGKYQ
jgi:hypothetical protein